MPDEREPIVLFDAINNPSKKMLLPTIKEQMIENVTKKDEPAVLLTTALATIDTYPEDWIKIYTDGSATNGTTNAGYGSYVQLPDGTKEEIYSSCGKYCSNYEAEAAAIIESLNFVSNLLKQNTINKTNIVILSDAKSVLQALANEIAKDPVIKKLTLTISEMIATHGIQVTLQWIPGHCNIKGNDEADRLAKLGAKCTQDKESATYGTAKQIIKQKKKEIWMKQWADSDKGRCIYAFMPTPDKGDCINQVKRDVQVTIFRLRSQHIQLNQHLNRIGIKTDAQCPLCRCSEESVAHHLFECTTLDDLRISLLPEKPNLTNTIYGTPEQLALTHKFHVMAQRRRASSQ